MLRTSDRNRFGRLFLVGILGVVLLICGTGSLSAEDREISGRALAQRPEGSSANGLNFAGNVSYTITFASGTARLKADEVRNTRSSGVSGTLRMVLWFTSVPYPSASSGYATAMYTLGTLSAGFSFFNVDSGPVAWFSPPNGIYYVTMTLEEFQSPGQYLYQDLVQFPNLVSIGSACTANATTLCLQNNRFQVTVNWSVPSQGTSGVGTVVPLTGDSGAVWFFSSNNYEMLLKVVDGRPVNGRFWFFGGMLTNVSFTITIVDTATGAVRTYSSVQGNVAIFQDTNAFLGP